MKSTLSIFLAILVGAFSLANAASFDCAKASTAVEGSVCGNPSLSALDEQLAATYKQARSVSSNPDAILTEQRSWIKTRNACGANISCLTAAYQQRIAALTPNTQSTQPAVSSQLPQQQPSASALINQAPQQQSSTQSQVQPQNEQRPKGIEEIRKFLVSKVAACGWKSAPESAGFFLGMTIPEAKAFADKQGYGLKCRESQPITGSSMSEIVKNSLNDEFSVSREWRASNLCETKVDGNEISLFFFKLTNVGEPLLAKAYNSLDKYVKDYPADTYAAAAPVMDALSEKFGFDVNKGGKTCSIDSGQGYQTQFDVTFARPYPDRTRDQPNISLFFTVTDKNLIKIGGAVTKARDEALKNSKQESERNELRNNASKL